MELPRALKAVLIDFDGTLYHLRTDYAGLRAALRALIGADADRLGIVQMCDRAKYDVRARVLETIASFEAVGVKEGEPMPGASRLLRRLASRGVLVAIVTRNLRATCLRAMARHGLRQPDEVIALDAPYPPKPDPAGTLAMMERRGLTKDDCILIGDGEPDLELGRRLGVVRVLVPNPRLASPPTSRPDYTFASLETLDDELSR